MPDAVNDSLTPEERARKEVAGWPPLTPAQRDQLALLLQPDGDHG